MAAIEIIIDLAKEAGRLLLQGADWLYGHFMDLPLFEKGILVSFIPAFFAVTLPIARHRLFDIYFYINNPLGVYMIAIVMIMGATHFFPGLPSFAGRVLVNIYYLFWVFYIHLGGGIAQTDYSLTAGYFVNIAVPLLFIALSVFSHLENR